MSPLLILLQQQLYLLLPSRRDEHGPSQPTENAILLAGAVTTTLFVVSAITRLVGANLPYWSTIEPSGRNPSMGQAVMATAAAFLLVVLLLDVPWLLLCQGWLAELATIN